MKNLLMIGSTLLVLSTSAYASTARLLALGMNETDNEGMYHVSDSRNIFLNPAYINVFNNFATVEWGNLGLNLPSTATTNNTTINSVTSPKAQGGIIAKRGDFIYGLYYGNESNTSALLRIAGTSAASATGSALTTGHMLKTTDNQLDLFFGGDNGLKWAGNLVFAQGKDESYSAKDNALSLRSGVIGSNWDAHLNVSLASKSEMTDTVTVAAAGITNASVVQEFKGKMGLHVGGSYLLDEKNRVFGYVKHYGWEQTDSFAYSAGQKAALGGQNGTVKGDFTSYYLGWGRDWDVNNGDKIFSSLAAKKTDINSKFDNKSEVRHLIVPLTVGYEAKATDWLVLRGSVVQNLWGTRDNKNITGTTSRLNAVAKQVIQSLYGGNGKTTISNSTAVNAGATLALGSLSVDGLVGLTSGARNGTTTAGLGQVGSNTGALTFDNLETTVAVTYKF